MFKQRIGVGTALTLLVGCLMWPGVVRGQSRWNLLEGIEADPAAFKELVIGEKIVYWQQRKVGPAIVEKDQIVYHFDKGTHELLDLRISWREDVPETLPKLAVSREQGESMVKGTVEFTELYIISPESDVFPIEPTPTNPCWVVTSIDDTGEMVKTVVDAVKAKVVGYGIVPPTYTSFSTTGPDWGECTPYWGWHRGNARYWFDKMGYTTEIVGAPAETKIKSHVQSFDTAMFYEIGHGGSTSFFAGCNEGVPYDVTASKIEDWIQDYPKMPFTFIASCGGMCSTGDNTFSYEFRKGSTERATTVGYCGMAESKCSRCWDYSLDWQSFLFAHMNQGHTVKEAFDYANSWRPACGDNQCMRFEGDEHFRVVPLIKRDPQFIYVDKDATGNNDGTSWENAYTDLNDALAAGDSCTEIWVAEGTYTPGTSRSDEFDIEYTGVRLYGGFDPGSGDDEWSERDWGENATILSGEIGEPTDADNCYHVIELEECDANTIIDGFTITDGYGSVYSDGGGIDVRESLVTIRNCVFDDNYAGDDGGAINILDDSVLTIVNCVFIDNEAGDDGGAIAIDTSCRVTLINCTFYDNVAEDMGGSIYNNGDDDVNSIIANCIFDSSYSPYSDDDIYNASSCGADPIISYCCTDDCGESGVDWDPDCGFDGGGNIDEGPDFVDDGDCEGDDDKWMTCDDGLRLESDSDCRDAGHNNSVPGYLDADIKGSDRIIGDYVDMGAYEYDSGC
ncbi:MAG: choice-of-anchor Q domain-containing protein [Planctomycetota bacterium]|jgi:hypothetical protein